MKYYLINEPCWSGREDQRLISIWKTSHELTPNKLVLYKFMRNDTGEIYCPKDFIHRDRILSIIVAESENIDELIERAAFDAL